VDADEGHAGLVQSMKLALRDAIERPILDVPDLPEGSDTQRAAVPPPLIKKGFFVA
jgi:hypothetical protein